MKLRVKEFWNSNKTFKTILCVLSCALIMSMNINSFVNSGNLIPGGITGLTLLIQRAMQKYLSLSIPYSILNIGLNAIPALIGFKMISKRFTIYSVAVIILNSFFVDFLPKIYMTHDPLLVSVFGGLINGLAISIALQGKASTGGTDFIAVYLNRKFNISSWNIILIFNSIILLIGGLLFGINASLYSIIFQFASTKMIETFHKANRKVTMLIITEHPKILASEIMKATHHGITKISGTGAYKEKEKTILYTVVSLDEVELVDYIVRKTDPNAFTNVLNSHSVKGRFYQDPLD